MKRLIAILALGAAMTAASTFAADAPEKKAAAKAKPSLELSGRYHQVHASSAKLSCDACHSKTQEDILFLRKDDAPPLLKTGQADPGRWVDRSVCLGCHQPGQKGSFWGVGK